MVYLAHVVAEFSGTSFVPQSGQRLFYDEAAQCMHIVEGRMVTAVPFPFLKPFVPDSSGASAAGQHSQTTTSAVGEGPSTLLETPRRFSPFFRAFTPVSQSSTGEDDDERMSKSQRAGSSLAEEPFEKTIEEEEEDDDNDKNYTSAEASDIEAIEAAPSDLMVSTPAPAVGQDVASKVVLHAPSDASDNDNDSEEEESFSFLASEGPPITAVRTMPGGGRATALQRSKESIEIIDHLTGNMFVASPSYKGAVLLGFLWTSCPGADFILTTSHGLELYTMTPGTQGLTLTATHKATDVKWYVWSPSTCLMLCGCGSSGNKVRMWQIAAPSVMTLPLLDLSPPWGSPVKGTTLGLMQGVQMASYLPFGGYIPSLSSFGLTSPTETSTPPPPPPIAANTAASIEDTATANSNDNNEGDALPISPSSPASSPAQSLHPNNITTTASSSSNVASSHSKTPARADVRSPVHPGTLPSVLTTPQASIDNPQTTHLSPSPSVENTCSSNIWVVPLYKRAYVCHYDPTAMTLRLYRVFRNATQLQHELPLLASKVDVSVVDNVLVIHAVPAVLRSPPDTTRTFPSSLSPSSSSATAATTTTTAAVAILIDVAGAGKVMTPLVAPKSLAVRDPTVSECYRSSSSMSLNNNSINSGDGYKITPVSSPRLRSQVLYTPITKPETTTTIETRGEGKGNEQEYHQYHEHDESEGEHFILGELLLCFPHWLVHPSSGRVLSLSLDLEGIAGSWQPLTKRPEKLIAFLQQRRVDSSLKIRLALKNRRLQEATATAEEEDDEDEDSVGRKTAREVALRVLIKLLEKHASPAVMRAVFNIVNEGYMSAVKLASKGAVQLNEITYITPEELVSCVFQEASERRDIPSVYMHAICAEYSRSCLAANFKVIPSFSTLYVDILLQAGESHMLSSFLNSHSSFLDSTQLAEHLETLFASGCLPHGFDLALSMHSRMGDYTRVCNCLLRRGRVLEAFRVLKQHKIETVLPTDCMAAAAVSGDILLFVAAYRLCQANVNPRMPELEEMLRQYGHHFEADAVEALIAAARS